MKSVFKIFQELKAENHNKTDGFVIVSLPAVKNHKIGVSAEELPMFFIKCEDANAAKLLDYNLEFIAIQFNRQCQLISNGKPSAKGFYTVISLKTDSIDLQEYFLDVVFLIVKNLPPVPTLKELKIEVEKLVNLFSQFSKPPQKTIQGLWAELLVIEQAKNPDYLIKAWHNETTDKFDFNDGIDKIEVKSTSKSKRIHSFSIEQLNPNKNSNLLIASVFTTETGTGTSIFNLLELIGKKIKDKNLFFRLNEITAKTLGKNFEKTFDVFFDYQLAVDSLEFYEGKFIPKIDIQSVPKQLSNIRFDCDLSEIEPIKNLKTTSLLYQALL